MEKRTYHTALSVNNEQKCWSYLAPFQRFT